MPKFVIIWNAGYGENWDCVEAADQEEAQKAAYEAWRDDAENNADYRAEPLTKESAENYGLEHELDEPAQ